MHINMVVETPSHGPPKNNIKNKTNNKIYTCRTLTTDSMVSIHPI